MAGTRNFKSVLLLSLVVFLHRRCSTHFSPWSCSQVLQTSYDDGRLPSKADLTLSTVLTSIGAVLLANLLVILANRKGRKLVFDTIETILAIVLVILLLSIVLGLPIGASSLSQQCLFWVRYTAITSFLCS